MKNIRATTYFALVTILGLISAAVVISQAKAPNRSAVVSESDTNEYGYMVNYISNIESLYFDCGNLKPLSELTRWKKRIGQKHSSGIPEWPFRN